MQSNEHEYGVQCKVSHKIKTLQLVLWELTNQSLIKNLPAQQYLKFNIFLFFFLNVVCLTWVRVGLALRLMSVALVTS